MCTLNVVVEPIMTVQLQLKDECSKSPTEVLKAGLSDLEEVMSTLSAKFQEAVGDI